MNLQRLQIPIERLSEMSGSLQGLRNLGFTPEAARALLGGVGAGYGSRVMSGGKGRSGPVRPLRPNARPQVSGQQSQPNPGGGRGR